jgi:curved DNA-binding protein CbpA
LSKFLINRSKFPNNPNATYAFQKVAVAYDILSKPSSKQLYDNRSPSASYDVFAARPSGHAEETFRSVLLGVLNDFLDGDLEVIRTLLSTSSSLFWLSSLVPISKISVPAGLF